MREAPGRTRIIGGLAALMASLMLAGCGGPTFPDVGDVSARLKDGRIEIANGTTRPVFTFAMGANMAALANWAACADPALCPPLPPGARKLVDWPPPFGGQPETTALVYWWHAVATPNGWRPDSVRVRGVSISPLLD